MQRKPLRYAVFGAGSVARRHLSEIGKEPGVAIVGIADPADRPAWKISDQYAAIPTFSDAERLLRETEPDLVSVCTPNVFHHELTLLALRFGAHVICEKPMAMSLGEAEAMEAARATAGKLGGINFSYRNVAGFRFARELVANGELGRLMRLSVVYLQSFRGVPTSLWSWRNDITVAGFGAMGDLGVHMIDAARFVSGLEFRRVIGLVQTSIPEKRDGSGALHRVTTDTNAVFLGELTNGVTATFEASQIVPGFGDFFRMELSGERGTLVVNSEHPTELRLRTGCSLARYATWKTDIPMHKVPTDFVLNGPPTSPSAIVHAIRGAKVEFPTFSDGVAAQRVLHGLIDSTRTGAWATLS